MIAHNGFDYSIIKFIAMREERNDININLIPILLILLRDYNLI